MRIEFELMEEDLIAFNREHLKQSKTYWARLVFGSCFCLCTLDYESYRDRTPVALLNVFVGHGRISWLDCL